MHTNLKGVASFIASALYPITVDARRMTDDERESVLYDTVNTLLFTDEQKADLYARLAERLTSTTAYGTAVYTIERAIYECQRP